MKIATKGIELMLAGWTRSHNAGTKVSFWIHEEDLPYFEKSTAAKGKTAGQRYVAQLVEMNDDDTPKMESVAHDSGWVEDKPQHKSKFPPGLVGLAVKWCLDEHFQDWIADAFGRQYSQGPVEFETDEEAARRIILEVCEIESRKELDTDKRAASIFIDRFKEPYAKARLEDAVDTAQLGTRR